MCKQNKAQARGLCHACHSLYSKQTESNKALRLDKQSTNQAHCTPGGNLSSCLARCATCAGLPERRSCAAVDACIGPCHDVTIQNPQIALVNIQSVVLQLRQPGGALLSFSAMHCTLYASSTSAGVSNAMVRESHVMLALPVFMPGLWLDMRVLRVRPHVKDP